MCDYLSTNQVAEETGIPAATLRYWRHANLGPASFTLGRRVVYRRTEVERWISSQELATRRGGGDAADVDAIQQVRDPRTGRPLRSGASSGDDAA